MSRTTTSKSSIGVSSSPCASPAAPSHRERGGALAVAAAPTGDVQGRRDPSRPPRSVRRPGFGGRRLRGRRPGAKAQVRGGRGAGAGLHQALPGRDRRGDCLVALGPLRQEVHSPCQRDLAVARSALELPSEHAFTGWPWAVPGFCWAPAPPSAPSLLWPRQHRFALRAHRPWWQGSAAPPTRAPEQ
jgi:hypothetical protein